MLDDDSLYCEEKSMKKLGQFGQLKTVIVLQKKTYRTEIAYWPPLLSLMRYVPSSLFDNKRAPEVFLFKPGWYHLEQ